METSESEAVEPITPQHDETDYRIPEPLPPNYPFIDISPTKTEILAGLGPSSSNSWHPQNSKIAKQDKSNELIFGLSYLRKVGIDKSHRFFFGGILEYSNETQKYAYTNGESVEQTHKKISLGPLMHYIAYKKDYFKINYLFSLQATALMSYVTYNNNDWGEDSRKLSVFALRAQGGIDFEWFFNKDKLALNFTLLSTVNQPYTLVGSGGTKPYIWGGDTTISNKLSATYAAFVGFTIYQ